MRITALTCAFLFFVSGCGGGDDTGGESSDGGASTSSAGKSGGGARSYKKKKEWDPALGTATVSGVVKFEGDAPRRRPIDMAGKAECSKLHTEPVLDESEIVGADGGLKNVLVWVKTGLDDWDFPKASEPVLLDQKGCMFHPHVIAVQAGQEVMIRNSDPFAHNVHANMIRNQPFNYTQANQGEEKPETFSKTEQMAYVKCDIHGWMSAYVNVMPNPYFVVTGDDGKFELTKLPPGEYTLEVEHEALGKQSMKVTVGDGETKSDLVFTFKEE